MAQTKSCKGAALSLLGRQPYTTRRLWDKLAQKGYPDGEVEETIGWCVEEGYLNDGEWALRAAARKAGKGWDAYRIKAYLRYYGIGREDIDDALEALARMGDTDEDGDGE
ncbi:MAG: recombination regulator RecX [Oscillospiraceae bacterium]|jgi:regulatory protein|nr:recombination regulator RecX [Oscillospiraceae bacterium]